jgi:hypothetical protein
MRFMLAAAAAILLVGCGVEVNHNQSGGESAPVEGYILDVRAADDVQIFMVTAPDGRVVAGRAENGVSALMDEAGIQSIAAIGPPPETPSQVSIRAPGVSISVNGDDAGGGGSVSINAGGHSVDVRADEGDTDRASVRIAGVDADAARDFIAKADELSPQVQAQMLAALGLDQ